MEFRDWLEIAILVFSFGVLYAKLNQIGRDVTGIKSCLYGADGSGGVVKETIIHGTKLECLETDVLSLEGRTMDIKEKCLKHELKIEGLEENLKSVEKRK